MVDSLSPGERPSSLDKAQVAAKALKMMAVDVVCPGEIDFAGGLDFYKDLVKTAGVSTVCANLTLDGKPVFDRYVVREVAGIRFGIFGLLWPDQPLRVDVKGALKLTSPIDAAKECVAELKDKVDIIIALTHEGMQADQKLASEVQPIQIILGGHSRDWQGRANQVKDTWIYQDGSRCQNIGRLSLEFRPAGKTPRPFKLTKVFEDLVLLNDKLPLDQPINKLVTDYNAAAAEKARKSVEPAAKAILPEPNEVYWGQVLCGQCHPKQNDFWKTTKHAHAYQTLVDAKKDKQIECLSCHVTGFQTLEIVQARQGRPASEVAGFENVQCESCHGPGSSHSKPEIRAHAHTQVTCVTCHTKDRSPQFDFASWLPRVQCPKGR